MAMLLSSDQQVRLDQIQSRRRRRTGRYGAPAYASAEDVEEFARLVYDRVVTLYIYELAHDGGFDFTIIDPTEYPFKGTLVRTVTIEPERGGRIAGA